MVPLFLKGCYGGQNVGDDALFAVMAYLLDRWFPASSVKVSSMGDIELPSTTLTLTPVTGRIGRARGMLTSRALIVGGGGVLQDYGPPFVPGELKTQLFLARVARLRRAPIAYIGVSLGPLNTEWSTRVVSKLLEWSAFVVFRDDTSYEEAQRLRPDPAKYRVSGDLALLLPEVGLPKPMPIHSVPERSLGVSISPFFREAYRDPCRDLPRYQALAAGLDGCLGERLIEHVRFVCFQGKNTDYAAVTQIREQMQHRRMTSIVPYIPNPAAVLEEVRHCEWFLASRLHSAIFAYMAELPFLMVNYHPKTQGFAQLVGVAQDAILPLEGLIGEEVYESVRALVSGAIPAPTVPATVLRERTMHEVGTVLDELRSMV